MPGIGRTDPIEGKISLGRTSRLSAAPLWIHFVEASTRGEGVDPQPDRAPSRLHGSVTGAIPIWDASKLIVPEILPNHG